MNNSTQKLLRSTDTFGKIFASRFFPMISTESKPKLHYLSTIVQRSPTEIITILFQKEFLESLIPGMTATAPQDDLCRSWTLFLDETLDSHCLLNLSINSGNSVHWDFSHPQGTVGGRIQFYKLPNNRGTFVNFISNLEPQREGLLVLVKKLFTNNDEHTMADVVRRFKALLEAGNIATTTDQS